MKKHEKQDLDTFLTDWQESSNNKNIFLHFKNYLSKKDGIDFDFIARPGVSYSLRGHHKKQQEKSLFVMIDVIDDLSRWLSICFYKEMVRDPEEKGDFVPGGLLGQDALCFDLEEQDTPLIKYIEARLDEAWACVAKQ